MNCLRCEANLRPEFTVLAISKEYTYKFCSFACLDTALSANEFTCDSVDMAKEFDGGPFLDSCF